MYKYIPGIACATRAIGLTNIYAQLTAMGWTLLDNQDGSSYRVYSSAGEAGTEPIGYVKIDTLTSGKITFTLYYYWNSGTHAGLGGSTAYQMNAADAGYTFWMWGDKNYVLIVTKTSGSYSSANFGHLPKRILTLKTTLTAPVTSGNGVTITVGSTAGFQAGSTYQIYGVAAEGRDAVIVTSITSLTQMVITNIPRNYGTGTIIGQMPSVFGGNGSGSAGFYHSEVSPQSCSGTGGATSESPNWSNYSYMGSNPDIRNFSAYTLQPLVAATAYYQYYSKGYIDTNILYMGSGASAEDTIDVGRQDTGTATSGGTATLTDTSKNWAVNAFANAVVLITFGTGIGQIMKISSNTANTLTLANNWVTAPDATSQYTIALEGYRAMSLTGPGLIALKEGV